MKQGPIHAWTKIAALAAAVVGMQFVPPRITEAAKRPVMGLGQSVKVLCVKFSDRPNIGRTCQQWVSRLNATAQIWYDNNSHSRTSFIFELPTIHAGQSLPANGWFPLTATAAVGLQVTDSMNRYVFPVVDAVVDFSSTDRLLIIGNEITSFAQASPAYSPYQAFLGHVPIKVNEHGSEELWMVAADGSSDFRRRVAVFMAWEGRFFDPAKLPGQFVDPVTGLIESEASMLHEISHLLGLPDRYFDLSFPTFRQAVANYSLMGFTNWQLAVSHWLAYERWQLGFAPINNSGTVISPGEWGIWRLAASQKTSLGANEHYLLRIPRGMNGTKFIGYTVEARKRHLPSTLAMTDDRVPEEGVVISWVNEALQDVNYRVIAVEDPNDPGQDKIALEVGDIYQDPAQGFLVEVRSQTTDGYEVYLEVFNPTDPQTDPGITGWDTVRWETPDIWIDSPSNNFVDEGGRLEHTNPDGTADGNGDRPLVGEINRIYFNVRNFGGTEAKNVTARVYTAYPGAGDAAARWTQRGTGFFSTIPANSLVTSFVEWVPDAANEGHACIKVVIDPIPNEYVSPNNLAQENIFEFESSRNSPFASKTQPLDIRNPFTDRSLDVILIASGLPNGWALTLEPWSFRLAPGASRSVDFRVHPAGTAQHPSAGYEEGQAFNIVLSVWGTETNGKRHELGGVTALTQLVYSETLTSQVLDTSPGQALLSGCLTPAVTNAQIALLFLDPSQKKVRRYVSTTANGCFQYNLLNAQPGTWKLDAVYDGTGAYGSAKAPQLVFTVP